MKCQPDEYKHTHIGVKVVEASLIPSARNANNESDRTAILGYVYGQGHRVVEVKEAGFGRVDLIFDNIREANKCLRDKGEGEELGNLLIFRFPTGRSGTKG